MRFARMPAVFVCGFAVLAAFYLPVPAFAAMKCSTILSAPIERREFRFEEESRISDLLTTPSKWIYTSSFTGLRAKVRAKGREVLYRFQYRGGEVRDLLLKLPEQRVEGAELDGLAEKPFGWETRDPDFRNQLNLEDRLSAETNAVLSDLYRLALGGRDSEMLSASDLHRRFVQLQYYRDILHAKTSELLPERMQPVGFFDRLPLVESDSFRIGQFTARNGLSGLYIREKPGRQIALKPFEILTRLLKTGALARVKDQGPGIGAHIDYAGGVSTFVQVIMGWRLKHRLKQCPSCRSGDAWENLPHDSLDFVINEYRDRRGIKDGVKSRSRNLTEEDLRRTREISELMMDRTLLFSEVSGQTSPVKNHFTDEDLATWQGRIPVNPPPSDRFDFLGSMNVVFSRGPHEPLPCEEYLGVRLPRPAEGKMMVELGRWAVMRGQPTPITKDMVNLVVSSLSAFGDIGEIVVQADPVHARMYRRPGVRDLEPPPGYHGSDEFLVMTLDAFKTLDY